ncbi:MbcA/ParS/Xre antitoxin family protein [Ramlibacter rhizophilus]|uniref:XRE family transcriptional regulator n=1 Tax=Ramlibacter rhizophilus TaxID=1781167 RepID=A0A4Z0BYD4_9BURK|nr:XRE family transcriptional regulator [Ramlibacter rhizophilus]TFZ03320.1 XRE family transcriptional regulator [Ramlibacter rhizophilus]
MQRHYATPEPTPAEVVLTKAVVRAATLLGLTHAALARIVGLSEASISRMASGKRHFELDTKPAELATLLVRVYRSLDALVGNDDRQRRAWMDSFNRAFNQTPREAVQTAEGLVQVLRYLDGARALA